ncbi:hypothetical protein V5799_009436 [Amblyomma americanum]|uniref:Uncharacterized protein n=1 Tax=Amblyomma americanum TaxID=6943 RepID=A0AAQ4FBS1_AMBAM
MEVEKGSWEEKLIASLKVSARRVNSGFPAPRDGIADDGEAAEATPSSTGQRAGGGSVLRHPPDAEAHQVVEDSSGRARRDRRARTLEERPGASNTHRFEAGAARDNAPTVT